METSEHLTPSARIVAAPFTESHLVHGALRERVVIVYRAGHHLHADEFASAGKLMRELDRIGKHGLTIASLFSGGMVLDRSSIRALNLYLRHGNGLAAYRRGAPWATVEHRHGWADLQRLVSLRWTR